MMLGTKYLFLRLWTSPVDSSVSSFSGPDLYLVVGSPIQWLWGSSVVESSTDWTPIRSFRTSDSLRDVLPSWFSVLSGPPVSPDPVTGRDGFGSPSSNALPSLLLHSMDLVPSSQRRRHTSPIVLEGRLFHLYTRVFLSEVCLVPGSIPMGFP